MNAQMNRAGRIRTVRTQTEATTVFVLRDMSSRHRTHAVVSGGHSGVEHLVYL